MAAYVDVVNLCASKLGEDDQLRSPDDDTHIGRSVKAVWNIVRRATLRAHTWNFARTRKSIPSDAAASIVGGDYAYPLPSDYIRMVDLIDYCDIKTFNIESQNILFHASGPLRIRYIRDVVETAYWDDLFVEAMASRLAFQVADRITGDRGRKSDAWNDFKAAISTAKKVNAQDRGKIEEEASDWELARYGYGDSGLHDRVLRGSSTYP